jgi:hypothetical protein
MPRRYWIYGLHLACEFDLPGALSGDSHTEPTVRVRLGLPYAPDTWLAAACLFRSPDLCANGQPAFTVECSRTTGWYRWRYCDGIVFCINQGADEIWADWPAGESHQCAAYYLVGPILAFVLRRRGALLLHGSSVAMGKAAVTFLGPSGAGKSTLAAALAKRGFSLLADDLMII